MIDIHRLADDVMACCIASEHKDYMADLRSRLPQRAMARVFGAVYRTESLSAPAMAPYIAVVLQNKRVIRIKPKDWLNDEYIARICLECP